MSTGPIIAADPWVHTVRGTCQGDVLEISGYGAQRPLGGSADIRLNGRTVVGDGVQRLREDISLPDAVYRFQMLCGREGFLVVVDRGVPTGDDVSYARGAARWAGTRFETYEAMSPARASDFWF